MSTTKLQQLNCVNNVLTVGDVVEFPHLCGDAPFVAVFFAEVGGGTIHQVLCQERVQELQQIGNAHLAEQKLSAWLLLQKVLQNCLLADLSKVEFCKHTGGKWTCNVCNFSISHTQNLVCVAISNNAVGVDVESLQSFAEKNKIPLPRLLARIASPDEQGTEPTPQNFLQLWTQKEAIFKSQCKQCFVSGSISTINQHADSYFFNLNGQQIVASVCGIGKQTFFVV